jgi:hypothetical protein
MILVVVLNSVRLETVLADSDVSDILFDAVLVDSYALLVACFICDHFSAGCAVRMLNTASFRLDPSRSGVEVKV